MNASVYFDRMIAIVIGIFLHISTTILFESNNTHRFNLYKLFVIVCGAGVALIMSSNFTFHSQVFGSKAVVTSF
jgi:hypothetical protein